MIPEVCSCLINELNGCKEDVLISIFLKNFVLLIWLELVQNMNSQIPCVIVEEVQLVLLQHKFCHFQILVIHDFNWNLGLPIDQKLNVSMIMIFHIFIFGFKIRNSFLSIDDHLLKVSIWIVLGFALIDQITVWDIELKQTKFVTQIKRKLLW